MLGAAGPGPTGDNSVPPAGAVAVGATTAPEGTGAGTARTGGTTGPPGTMAGADGTTGTPSNGAVAPGGVSSKDRPTPIVPRFSSASASESRKKMVPRIAVVRVSRFAVPRPDMNPPIPWDVPMPRPPPSLRWINTTPIRARVTNRWISSRTVVMAGLLKARAWVGKVRHPMSPQ